MKSSLPRHLLEREVFSAWFSIHDSCLTSIPNLQITNRPVPNGSRMSRGYLQEEIHLATDPTLAA
jgi:hypothetical protein